MKALMLATEYPPAKGYGLARYVSELSAALAKMDVEVHVVCMNSLDGCPEQVRDGVHVHLMTERLGFESFSWVSDTVLDNVRLLECAVQVCEEEHFDLIAAHDWLGALAAKALKTIYDIPLVLTVHDTEVGKRSNKLTREQLYVSEVEGWIAKIADRNKIE